MRLYNEQLVIRHLRRSPSSCPLQPIQSIGARVVDPTRCARLGYVHAGYAPTCYYSDPDGLASTAPVAVNLASRCLPGRFTLEGEEELSQERSECLLFLTTQCGEQVALILHVDGGDRIDQRLSRTCERHQCAASISWIGHLFNKPGALELMKPVGHCT
jgi:hypothetical protein